MISEEERESIINETLERAMTMLPEVIGNLMVSHASILRINKEFYEKHKDLSSHKDVVQSVVEFVEGQNPGLEYDKILEKAVPLIKERIRTVGSLDLKSSPRPSRNLSHLEFKGNGEI